MPPQAHETPSGLLPIAAIAPGDLELVARLRRLDPAPVDRARVLELGCGAGENLLPLADRYPEGRFVGIDAAPRNVEVARLIARESGLTNIEFWPRDPRDPGPDLTGFDYVLLHRAYAGADDAGRSRLLAACRAALSSRGVACVSYPVLPGHAVHEMFREMMRYEARSATQPAEAVAQARRLLSFFTASLLQDHPFDRTARAETSLLSALDDPTLWRDYLAASGRGVFYPQFVEQVQRASLQVVGDLAIGIAPGDTLWPEAEQQLATLAVAATARELLRDVVQNRSHRYSVLVPEGAAVSWPLERSQLEGLYFEGNLAPENPLGDIASPATIHFVDPRQMRTTTASPLVKAALAHLGQAWPDFVRFDELVAAACTRIGPDVPPDAVARLKENLLHLAVAGSVRLHTRPPSFVSKPSAKPQASPLARLQARGGTVVNRRHEAVPLDPFDRALLAELDGTRDLDALVAALSAKVEAGSLVASRHEQPLNTPASAQAAFGEALPGALARLARAALLIA